MKSGIVALINNGLLKNIPYKLYTLQFMNKFMNIKEFLQNCIIEP